MAENPLQQIRRLPQYHLPELRGKAKINTDLSLTEHTEGAEIKDFSIALEKAGNGKMLSPAKKIRNKIFVNSVSSVRDSIG